jgi:hypothetical protein
MCGLAFDLSRLRGLAKPAVAGLPERNAKGLPTFVRRRRCAKIGGVSHQSEACERGSPWSRLHEVVPGVKRCAWGPTWPSA